MRVQDQGRWQGRDKVAEGAAVRAGQVQGGDDAAVLRSEEDGQGARPDRADQGREGQEGIEEGPDRL